jgi:hypothetical protein
MGRPKVLGFVLACALGLSSCVITSHGTPPQAVRDQPDTFRFRIFPAAVVMEETFADRAADQEIAKFRSANGYASSVIRSRDHQDLAFVYTVEFSR